MSSQNVNKKIWISVAVFAVIIISAYFIFNSYNSHSRAVATLKSELNAIPELNAKYKQEGTSLILNTADIHGANDLKISVGSPDAQEFKPELNVEKWDGEVKMKVSTPIQSTDAQVVSFEKDKIKVDANGVEYRMYDLPAEARVEQDAKEGVIKDGKFELDAIIKTKPTTNVFTWNIETENLDFFYQPPLNQEDGPLARGPSSGGVTCIPTECRDKNGVVIMQRPENVVGSYAVYYKGGKSGDYSQMGGKNYGTGKSFHIYRPLITDAAGKTTWGELSISNDKSQISNQSSNDQMSNDKNFEIGNLKFGILSVKVPQDFLDNASYPITVDPTFGWGLFGGSTGYVKDYIIANGDTVSPANNGILVSISLYCSIGTAGHVKMAIYNNNDLVDYTDSVSVPVSAGWATGNVTNSASVVPTTGYLLGFKFDHTTTVYYDSGATNGYKFASNAFASGFPNPVTWSSGSALQHSIYATYTASAPAVTPTPSKIWVKGGVKIKGGVNVK
jgi:hypothetical protein